jgi:hypothetical protein
LLEAAAAVLGREAPGIRLGADEGAERVAVGRAIEAYGYWHDGTFFATSFEDEPLSR